jgi:DNA-binding GntR family transcriptional regulator
VHRRPRPAATGRHSPFSARSPLDVPSPTQLGHTFELAAILEAHAVVRVAGATRPDLIAARRGLANLDCAIETRQLERWANLEIEFHVALNDQSGNSVLAAMAERTLREGLAACPILSPDVLRVFQSHHRTILRCVEGRDADAAAQHTRTHMFFLRDALASSLQGKPPSTRRLRT